MRVKYLSMILFFFSQVTHAALPPTAESMRRIKAVMDSREVYDTLGAVNVIQSITQTQDGYLLASDKCTLDVTVSAGPQDPPGMIGPLPLIVKVGKLDCKKTL